eukprot:6179877-Pleurochrysis_carterae.AAC.1
MRVRHRIGFALSASGLDAWAIVWSPSRSSQWFLSLRHAHRHTLRLRAGPLNGRVLARRPSWQREQWPFGHDPERQNSLLPRLHASLWSSVSLSLSTFSQNLGHLVAIPRGRTGMQLRALKEWGREETRDWRKKTPQRRWSNWPICRLRLSRR